MTDEAEKNGDKEDLKIAVIPDDSTTSKRIYSNFVAVNQSAHDFSLKFCDAPPIYDINKVRDNDGVHLAPVVAEIIIPFEVMPGLIKVLQAQYRKRQDIVEQMDSENKKES